MSIRRKIKDLPYLTPTDLLKFLTMEPINKMAREGKIMVGKSVPLEHLSLWDYLTSIPSKFRDDPKYNGKYSEAILNIAGKFVSEGLISPLPGKTGVFQKYQGNGYNAKLAEYGYYDFLVYGFPYIINHFKDAVRVIEVQDLHTKDFSVGTGFSILFAPDRQFFVTAKHCLPKGSKINLKVFLGSKGYASPENIYVHPDQNIDIAILQFSDSVLLSDKFFHLEAPELLDEIVVAGYPPIPGSVEATMVVSKGEITAVSGTYLHKYKQIYVNANVKGGSSGSPIIDSTGNVVGIIIESARDAVDNTLQDELRFGTGLPSSLIYLISTMILDNNPELKKIDFKKNEDGSFTIL
ncbi:serine protease [Chryseobacterium gambrini]|uniref:Trypsin-like peptidase domain-containing protein n=1 Tax=Chryseobacterium gambrini TaxID=373672 RepID=A0ABN7CE16_9FLAO|nr:hypothetical protein CRDW_19680 [Chryseobacterium gambrini]